MRIFLLGPTKTLTYFYETLSACGISEGFYLFDNLMSVRLILYLRGDGPSLPLRYCLLSVHFQLTKPFKLATG
jgi:hypothetical protein